MNEDIATINKSDTIIIKSDKTDNNYQIDVDTYHNAINRKVNKIYKKAPDYWENSINSEARKTATNLKNRG